MSDDLVSRLRDEAVRLSGQSIDRGCVDSGIGSNLADAAADALTEARAEIERLRAEVYVPGQWRCAKCKFTLQQMNLNANTGTVTARDNAGDKCPNCNSPLWRATWKQDAHEMLDRATEQMERVKVAESELSTLRARVREVVGLRSALEHLLSFQFSEATRSGKFSDLCKAWIERKKAAKQLMEAVEP